MAFLGGGLAATLLLNGLRTAFPRRVVVIDPWPTLKQPPVHWSYWSRGPTPYDRFAVGTWLRARVADAPPEPIAPFDAGWCVPPLCSQPWTSPSELCPSSGFAPPRFR